MPPPYTPSPSEQHIWWPGVAFMFGIVGLFGLFVWLWSKKKDREYAIQSAEWLRKAAPYKHSNPRAYAILEETEFRYAEGTPQWIECLLKIQKIIDNA